MEELKKLVEIVTLRGRKNHPFLDIKSGDFEQNKELRLFRVIQQLDPATDQAAAKEMYNSGVEDPRYKMLKHRIKSKLLNHLFFVDFKDHSSSVAYRFEQEALNYLYYAQVLLKNKEPDLAEKTISKGLSLAKEGEFTGIVISFLELLREVHSIKCQSNDFRNNAKQLKKYRKIYADESLAEDLYQAISLKLRKSVNSRRKSLAQAIRTTRRLKDLQGKTPSFGIFEKHHWLNLWCHQLTGNYEEVIRITRKMERQYQNSELNVRRFDLRSNKLKQLRAYLRAGRGEEALVICKSLSNFFDKTTQDYIRYLEDYFLLTMQNKEYKRGAEILKLATRSPYQHKLDRDCINRWELYRAYLYLGSPEKRLLRTINHKLFFEQLPDYHKDHKGFNIAILILQFVNHFSKGEHSRLVKIVEELKTYSKLHLYHGVSQRSRIFVKLLLMAWDNDFSLGTCQTKSLVPLEKLEKLHPPEELSIEIEVLPYPHLWELMVTAMVRSK